MYDTPKMKIAKLYMESNQKLIKYICPTFSPEEARTIVEHFLEATALPARDLTGPSARDIVRWMAAQRAGYSVRKEARRRYDEWESRVDGVPLCRCSASPEPHWHFGDAEEAASPPAWNSILAPGSVLPRIHVSDEPGKGPGYVILGYRSHVPKIGDCYKLKASGRAVIITELLDAAQILRIQFDDGEIVAVPLSELIRDAEPIE
jgi:hypothetical protein